MCVLAPVEGSFVSSITPLVLLGPVKLNTGNLFKTTVRCLSVEAPGLAGPGTRREKRRPRGGVLLRMGQPHHCSSPSLFPESPPCWAGGAVAVVASCPPAHLPHSADTFLPIYCNTYLSLPALVSVLGCLYSRKKSL